MRTLIRKCSECKRYTMLENCPVCGNQTVFAVPPKYSPVDRFQKFRIKELEARKNGKDNNSSV